MPIVQDFRKFRFDRRRIDRCGKHIGRQIYWKLYVVENLVRSFIHSVLWVQINARWWDVAVDPKIRKRAQDLQQYYSQRPWHTLPGRHAIYYVFLSDLNNIIRANSNLFLPIVSDIDQWITRVEEIRLPRNIVGHMNFPNQADRQRIDAMYSDFVSLVGKIQNSGVQIRVP